MKWDFNKLKVTNKNGFGKWITQSLSRSPYYLSLLEYPSLKSKEIFTEYFNILNVDYEMSYDNFIKLYKDMRDNGVSKDFNVNITADGVISDGQHRMAILYYLGADTIENNTNVKWGEQMSKDQDDLNAEAVYEKGWTRDNNNLIKQRVDRDDHSNGEKKEQVIQARDPGDENDAPA